VIELRAVCVHVQSAFNLITININTTLL